ncbi:hypothetical protein BDV95DRAFT_607820 [Massariosphaeria phaeospora]|uniref:Uncharacterized protein n=1 Tax=Massariosphaeria phaeospora TaxID=100035 RepID=A0A7C8M7B5_9PLEO|nr:hypothetical protein BDV95DRAFT_607820 [Massariosphaeria phaeospora]
MNSPAPRYIPAELLLHILPNLTVVPKRLCKPYTALTTEERKDEDVRVAENGVTIKTLASVCLVSRTFFKIGQSLLYSAFILNSQSPNAPRSVLGLLRTITEKPELAKHIQYIENNFQEIDFTQFETSKQNSTYDEVCDMLATGLISDAATRTYLSLNNALPMFRWNPRVADFEEYLGANSAGWASELVTFPEQALLALVTALAPNVARLALTSIEYRASHLFWEYCGFSPAHFRPAAQSRPASCFHGFKNLRNLRMIVITPPNSNKSWYDYKPHTNWHPNFELSLEHIGSLASLHIWGLKEINPAYKYKEPLVNLTTIELLDCDIGDRAIADLIRRSRGLRHFACVWAPNMCRSQNGGSILDLWPALELHKSTLESLTLDVKAMNGNGVDDSLNQKLEFGHDAFRSFQPLKILEIGLEHLVLLGWRGWRDNHVGAFQFRKWSPQYRKQLAEILPAGFERLSIILSESNKSIMGLLAVKLYKGSPYEPGTGLRLDFVDLYVGEWVAEGGVLLASSEDRMVLGRGNGVGAWGMGYG